MTAATTCLWIAFGIYSIALVATAVIYCPGKSGTEASLATLGLVLLLGAGYWGRFELDGWLRTQRALQAAAAALPEPAPPKPPAAPKDWWQQPYRIVGTQNGNIRIKITGNGNSANPGTNMAPVTQGPCGVVQNGGSNNTASPTCGFVQRHLTELQRTELAAALKGKGVKVTFGALMNSPDAQEYASELCSVFLDIKISSDCSIAPMMHTDGPPWAGIRVVYKGTQTEPGETTIPDTSPAGEVISALVSAKLVPPIWAGQIPSMDEDSVMLVIGFPPESKR